MVDIWQSDADGQYSSPDPDETFLRGAQVTNSAGVVEFGTIYTAGDTDNASDGTFEETLVLATQPEGDGYLGIISFDVQRA